MQKTLFALFILVFSVQSCMKKDCTIRDPFTSIEIANYKCKSDCKTDAEILSRPVVALVERAVAHGGAWRSLRDRAGRYPRGRAGELSRDPAEQEGSGDLA